MTAKDKLQQLRDIINALPDNMRGIHAGYVEYFGELRGLPYSKEIKTLAHLMDFFIGDMKDHLRMQMNATYFQADRFLFERAFDQLKHSKTNLEKLQPFIKYMEATGKGLTELKYYSLDLFCWISSLYGLLTTIRAFKKAIGATKGFNFMENALQLKKTSIKWEKTSLEGIKDACINAESYQFEDRLSLLNKCIELLPDNGLFIKLYPINFSKLRPTTKTINTIVESGRFFSKHICTETESGGSLIYMTQFHEAYREQVTEVYDPILDELCICEREMYPRTYEELREFFGFGI